MALLVMLSVVITTITGFEKTVDVEPAKAAIAKATKATTAEAAKATTSAEAESAEAAIAKATEAATAGRGSNSIIRGSQGNNKCRGSNSKGSNSR